MFLGPSCCIQLCNSCSTCEMVRNKKKGHAGETTPIKVWFSPIEVRAAAPVCIFVAAMDPIIVSAPGKVILHGEHAVVYGKVGRNDIMCIRWCDDLYHASTYQELLTGRCYEAEISSILLLLRCPFQWYPILSNSTLCCGYPRPSPPLCV